MAMRNPYWIPRTKAMILDALDFYAQVGPVEQRAEAAEAWHKWAGHIRAEWERRGDGEGLGDSHANRS